MIETSPQQTISTNFAQTASDFKTPEEIIVSALAQTVLSNFVGKPETPPSFFEKATEKESEQPQLKERATEKETAKEKSFERSEGQKTEARTQTRSETMHSQQRTAEKATSSPTQKEGQKTTEKGAEHTFTHRTESEAFAQPLAKPQPQLPPPPTQTRGRKEGHTAKQEPSGTLRKATPQSIFTKAQQRGETQRVPTPNQLRVDRDNEREQKKNKQHAPRKVKKAQKSEGTSKVDRIAQEHFPTAEQNDFKHFLRVMMQDSDLSDYFGTRISHFDVLLLFIEVMKLEIHDHHQERIARQSEREYQIEWMEGVVKHLKSQAKFLLFAGVGAGVLGVVSGLLPIVGHVKGDWIIDKLRSAWSGFEHLKRNKTFDNVSKACFAIAEMNKAMGQVQSSFCEAERQWADHKSNLHRTDGEESTRTMEEHNREFKTWNETLTQILRMEQELARMLYQ